MPTKLGVSPQAVALRKRLASGRLLPQDKARIALATQIHALRSEGLTFSACAARLGLPEKRVAAFAAGQIFDTILAHHERVEAGADEPGHAQATIEKRARVRRLASPALDRLEGNLLGDNARAADRAMEIVLEANGLLEPEVARPVVHISQLVVNQQVAISRADDEELARLRDVATNAETLPDPDEAPSHRRANGGN